MSRCRYTLICFQVPYGQFVCSELGQVSCVVVSVIIEVNHWWIEEFVLSYAFPAAWFVAWEFGLVREHDLVVVIHLDVFLINPVLEVTSLVCIPLFMVWMSVIRIFGPAVDGRGRIV